ncbi:PREDICTED: transcription factor grauzone-like isoform X2 [Rhagoletis zephyria]|uniref:transcription factor grauzone-like isoform X2 n=1 Tax=Rhagoletis zephyria TaxID=28612 RepID=UPI0008116741|nr:PREDICTED: transcription factor grauzone-like isoform X2 [Rhagoletis zephyria]
MVDNFPPLQNGHRNSFVFNKMLCRVCLEEAECCLEIFDVNGERLAIAGILERHFWFYLLPTDTISTAICRLCWQKVSEFHQFYLAVEKAHFLLNRTDVKHGAVSRVENEEFVESSYQIKEEEYLEHLLQTEQAEETLNPLAVPECENCAAESKVKEELNVELNLAEITPCTDKVGQKRKSVRGRPPGDKEFKTAAEHDNGDNEFENDEQAKPKQKVIKSNSQDAAIVKKHIVLGCDLCAFVGEDFFAISKHFRLQHPNIKAYIRCCNKKFTQRCRVVQHAYKHEDPHFFKCQECQRVFSDSTTLRSHMISAHAPEEELNFACDQCPKKFSRKYLLELHRPSHVPKSEHAFVCDQCPSSRFASSRLLKIHISMQHRRAKRVCHVCAKEIRSKAAFEKHLRVHIGDSEPRIKCPRPDCDRWLKDAENLRHHMKRHSVEGQVLTCKECGRTYKNRPALYSHMFYVHPKEVFACKQCNKTFKKAISLREHMAQHTGETLYKCPFCTRTFNSNANMHSHKKKMHPIEWNTSRKEKLEGTQSKSKPQSDI